MYYIQMYRTSIRIVMHIYYTSILKSTHSGMKRDKYNIMLIF